MYTLHNAHLCTITSYYYNLTFGQISNKINTASWHKVTNYQRKCLLPQQWLQLFPSSSEHQSQICHQPESIASNNMTSIAQTRPDSNCQEKKHTNISSQIFLLETEPLQNLECKNIMYLSLNLSVIIIETKIHLFA